MAKPASVKERLHRGYAQTMDVTRMLADENSRYQHIRIFDTVANGRVYVGTRGNNTGGVYGSTPISGELDVYGLEPR